MKHVVRLLALACTAVLFTPGCGGGGGNGGGGGGTKSFTGIWSGTTKSNSGGGGNLTVQITQTGANTVGTDLLDSTGQIVLGTSAGTVSGSTANVNINYGAKFGTAVVKFTLSGNMLNGTYTRSANGTVVDSGSVNLTLSAVTSTANVAGNYIGTSTKTGGTPTALSFTVAQNGDQLTITSGLSGGATAFTGSGVMVGDTFGAVLTDTGSTDTIDLIGTLSGTTISGTFWEPGTNSGNNGTAVTGTFSMSTVQAQ